MATGGRKLPLRRSTRVTKSPDAAESTSSMPSVASSSKHRAQGPTEGPLKKRKAAVSAEEPPKKKRKARGQLEHYRLKKLDFPLGSNAATLREQVKKEFAHLLKCDEPLVANKARGVDARRAQVNQAWEDRYLEFLIFSKEYGHKHVPKMYVDNPELGRWTVKIRRWKKEKDKNLTKSRLKRLEAAGFIWDPKADPDFWKIQNENEKALDLWEDNYNDLLKYKEEHGDCNVPKIFPPNERLSRWVARQRHHYKAKQANEYHTLTDEKEQRLLDVGFVFNTRTKELLRQQSLKHYEDRWDGFCKRLVAFKEEYGHCAVPRRWKRDMQLASWVMRQRVQWKNKQQGEHSYLSDGRIEQLKEIGFVFGAIDRKIYPADGIMRGTPKTSALRSKTSISSGDDSDDEEADKDGVSQRDGQQEETAVAPPGKRGTRNTEANNEAAKKTTHKTRASDEAAGVPQEKEQLREAAEAPSDKRDTSKSITGNAKKRSFTLSSTTKASASAKRSSKPKAPDETGVSQGKRKSRATAVAPPEKRGTPKTKPGDASLMTTNGRTRTLGNPKTNAINAATTKTSVLAEEASNGNDSGTSEAFQRKEQQRKTVVAPPGTLGIIISNRAKSKGTVVSDVRTTSVLKGKILPGDRITAIDDEDVSCMTASEISKLIASKSDSEKKLTVTRGATKGKEKEGKATN